MNERLDDVPSNYGMSPAQESNGTGMGIPMTTGESHLFFFLSQYQKLGSYNYYYRALRLPNNIM